MMPGIPCKPSEIDAMRAWAKAGATVSQIMAKFNRSRPTVCKHTRGINAHRRVHMKVKLSRRPITLSSHPDPVPVGRGRNDSIGASLTEPGYRPSDRTPSDFAPAGINPSRVETEL